MTQRITYIANDGTEFDDEIECTNYEMIQDICEGTLEFYIGDERVCNDDIITDRTYNSVTKIIVNSEYDLELIRKIEKEYGFISYESINSIGTWIYKDATHGLGEFIKDV